jgi:hypothetical protein
MGSVPQWFTKLGLMIGRQQASTTDAERQAIFFYPKLCRSLNQAATQSTVHTANNATGDAGATDSVDLWNSSQERVFLYFFNLH